MLTMKRLYLYGVLGVALVLLLWGLTDLVRFALEQLSRALGTSPAFGDRLGREELSLAVALVLVAGSIFGVHLAFIRRSLRGDPADVADERASASRSTYFFLVLLGTGAVLFWASYSTDLSTDRFSGLRCAWSRRDRATRERARGGHGLGVACPRSPDRPASRPGTDRRRLAHARLSLRCALRDLPRGGHPGRRGPDHGGATGARSSAGLGVAELVAGRHHRSGRCHLGGLDRVAGALGHGRTPAARTRPDGRSAPGRPDPSRLLPRRGVDQCCGRARPGLVGSGQPLR